MRTRCAVLLAALAAIAAAMVVLASPAAGQPPTSGSAYPWVQPWMIHGGSAPIARPATQPGVGVGVAVERPNEDAAAAVGLQTSYSWVQPWQISTGSAPTVDRLTEPAAVPVG